MIELKEPPIEIDLGFEKITITVSTCMSEKTALEFYYKDYMNYIQENPNQDDFDMWSCYFCNIGGYNIIWVEEFNCIPQCEHCGTFIFPSDYTNPQLNEFWKK